MKGQLFIPQKTRITLKWLKAILLLIVSIQTIHAQTNTDSLIIKNDPKKVNFLIEIPVWFPGLRSTFSIGDITLEGDGKFKDIFSQYFKSAGGIDYYFVGKFGITVKKWHFAIDVFGGQFQKVVTYSYNQTLLKDLELFTIMPSLILGYQIFEYDFERRSKKRKFEVWPYAGCRFYYVNIKNSSYAVIPAFEIDRNWTDPIIGFAVQMMLNRFTIAFDNDVGGLGLGSDITYWSRLSGAFKFAKFLAIKVGWTYQNINYSEEKRRETFNYKLVLQGPIAGLSFNF